MANCCLAFLILELIASFAAEAHGGCFVHPTGIAVSAGERVSLTCSTNEGYSISSWQIGKDTETKTAVYAAHVYKPDGTVRMPQFIADGYNVSRPGDNETILHINKATLSQAGSYVCTCDDPFRNTDTSTVVVLESEPKFSTDRRVTDGESVIFSCSISFNGSSDVSCELTIEDAFGYTVAGQASVTVKNNLTFCNLKHSIIANASPDQSHTCNVTLTTTRKDVIYSQVLRVVGEWQPVSVTIEFASEDLRIEANRCDSELGLRIGIAISCAIIVILGSVIMLLYRKLLQKSRSTTDHRTRDFDHKTTPASYTTLNIQQSSEEMQRDVYTEIQLST